MPDYDYRTPDADSLWCEISFFLPTAAAPALINELTRIADANEWIAFGSASPDEISESFEVVFFEMITTCGEFLHDESENVLTDESGDLLEPG